MGEVIPHSVGMAERFLCVGYGLTLFIWFVSGNVHVPHVIEGKALLGFPFGVGVRAEGGDCTCPWFLYQKDVEMCVTLEKRGDVFV